MKLLSCPVTSVTGTWKVLWQSSAVQEKTRAFFLATFGILAFFSVFEDYSPVRSLASLSLQSLRLLFCLVTGVTEASVFETTLLSGHWRQWGFCLWILLSCPVTSVTGTWEVLWQSSALRKNARFLSCDTWYSGKVFCLWNYSPVRSLASLGLEKFCDKVPHCGKTRDVRCTLPVVTKFFK